MKFNINRWLKLSGLVEANAKIVTESFSGIGNVSTDGMEQGVHSNAGMGSDLEIVDNLELQDDLETQEDLSESFIQSTTGSSSWAGSPLNSMGGVGALCTMLALVDHPSGKAGSWTFSNGFPRLMPVAFNKSSDIQASEIVKTWKNVIGTDLRIGTPSDENQGDIQTDDGTNWECKHSIGMTGGGGDYGLQIEFTSRNAGSGLGLAFYSLAKNRFGDEVFTTQKLCPNASQMRSWFQADAAARDAFKAWIVSRADEGCFVSNVVTGDTFKIYWASLETVRSTFEAMDMSKFVSSYYTATTGWGRPRYGFKIPVLLGAERTADLASLAQATGNWAPGQSTDSDFFKQESGRFVIKLIDQLISSSPYKYTTPSQENWWALGQEPFRAAWLREIIKLNNNAVPDRNLKVTVKKEGRIESWNKSMTWSKWANKRNSETVHKILENDKEYEVSIKPGQSASQSASEEKPASATQLSKPMGKKAGRTQISRRNKLLALHKNQADKGDGENTFKTKADKLVDKWKEQGYSSKTGGDKRKWDEPDFEAFAENKLYKNSLSSLLIENEETNPESMEEIIHQIPDEFEFLKDYLAGIEI